MGENLGILVSSDIGNVSFAIMRYWGVPAVPSIRAGAGSNAPSGPKHILLKRPNPRRHSYNDEVHSVPKDSNNKGHDDRVGVSSLAAMTSGAHAL